MSAPFAAIQVCDFAQTYAESLVATDLVDQLCSYIPNADDLVRRQIRSALKLAHVHGAQDYRSALERIEVKP